MKMDSHEKPIELSRKKSAYSVYVYGADVRLFPNKRLNVDLKNIEIWVSRGLTQNLKAPSFLSAGGPLATGIK